MVNPYTKAAKTYQSASDENLTPLQIVVELYKGILKNLKQGKQAYRDNDFERVIELNSKTIDILEALQNHLDMENGGEDSKFLFDFYNIVYVKVMRIMAVADGLAEYDSTIAYVQPVYERWYGFAYGAVPGAQAAAQMAE